MLLMDETGVGVLNRQLRLLLILYAGTSLLHFAHNAENVENYPNLPTWLSRADVYAAWGCVTVVGLLGYALYRKGSEMLGVTVLAVYAALGFYALFHYSRAPFSAHTSTMNLTIWSEVIAAALVLIALGNLALTRVRRRE